MAEKGQEKHGEDHGGARHGGGGHEKKTNHGQKHEGTPKHESPPTHASKAWLSQEDKGLIASAPLLVPSAVYETFKGVYTIGKVILKGLTAPFRYLARVLAG